jgi:serine/threonine protein kinase/tetratricopeptide (TPR) repeat protein
MPEPQAASPKEACDVPDLTGTMVGRFVIRSRLGAGGMGEVYRADDTRLKRAVALKRMAPRLRADEHYRQRFLKEAEHASCLSDQRIAGIYDVLEESDDTFLVMEYVEGVTLRDRLTGPYSLTDFLPIAIQCAEALVAAHEKGVVHRDIKPENIMLTPRGQVKILDFGVAKRLPRVDDDKGPGSTASGSRQLTGTPAYMAPEVLVEHPSDERADIFSLGVVLYEMLAGQHPFRTESFLETTDRILHATPLPLSQVNPQIPESLTQLVSQMLAKDPADRYPAATDLLRDLRALAQPGTDPTPSTATAARSVTRRRTAAIAGILAVLAIVAGLVIVRWSRPPAVLPERGSILVADFQNQTPEKLFDRTISPLLSQSLLQSRYVSVVPRVQVLEAARRTGREDVSTVDAALGRDICLREGYRALLTGQIITSGPAYQLVVQVVDPAQGLPVITETEVIRSAADLYNGVDQLANRLRRRLGESLGQIEKGSKPLARVTTPSLEALQRYSRALDLYAARDFDGSVALAESAVEKDPDFAMAHFLLARDYDALGDENSALAHLALARQGLEHVTEREQHLILAQDYSVQDLEQEAMEEYRLLLELDPNDIEALRGIAVSEFWTGRTEEAIQAAQKAARLNPYSAYDYTLLMQYLVRAGRFRETLAVYREAGAHKVENPQLHWSTGLAHWGLDNLGAARGEFELLRRAGGTYEENLAQLYLPRLKTYEGRMREAGEGLRAGLVLDQKQHSETWAPVRHYLLARVALSRGNLAEARLESRQLGAAARQLGAGARAGAAPENLQRAGWLALELHDLGSAQRFLELLDKQRSPQGKTYTECLYFNLKGDLELATGNTSAAIESQRRALLLLSLPEIYASLGQAYAAQEDWRGAIQAYEQYLKCKGMLLRDDFAGAWVLAHLWLARAHARAGETPQALHYYDEFLRLWAGADADLPSLRQARAERQELALSGARH